MNPLPVPSNSILSGLSAPAVPNSAAGAQFERRLDPARFIRIHRRTIVNVEAIKEFEPWTSGELIVVLHDKTKLKLSRTHRDRLRKLTGDL